MCEFADTLDQAWVRAYYCAVSFISAGIAQFPQGGALQTSTGNGSYAVFMASLDFPLQISAWPEGGAPAV